MVVKAELEKLGLHTKSVELGEVQLVEQELSASQAQSLRDNLETLGFELIDDRKSRTIEKIKTVIIDLVHHSAGDTRLKHSEYIAKELNYEYTYLSKLFSEVEGVTIEQYIINQKIEKVKELIVYDEQSLSEISFRLGYSSVAHLSAQFKKVSGIKHRMPIDKTGNNTTS
jgi:AraC-like DNA-binding protein